MRPESSDVCALGRCDRPATFRLDWRGGICDSHADAIWYAVEMRDTDRCDEEVTGAEGREYVRAEARAKRSVDRRKPTAMGEIYYVRVDGLIKVGWTSKLADRMRAYGPKAVLLANYPGTRADEAALHRQLTPARFRGREWYSETDVIRMFIAEAIKKYGPPRFDRLEWTEPRDVVATKRATRRR